MTHHHCEKCHSHEGHGHHHHHHSCCHTHAHGHEEECSCCGHHGFESHHDFVHVLIDMADHAWMEVLKEKIKQRILETNGDQLDQLAKTISEGNHARWKNKLAIIKNQHDLKNKIDDIFGCPSGSCKS